MKEPLVLIVDDHPMMRETLVSVFKWEPVETSDFQWCPLADWPLRRIPTDWMGTVLEGRRNADLS